MTTSLGNPEDHEMLPEALIAGGGHCEDGRIGAFERAQDTRPDSAGQDPRRRRSRGFTLVELLVVLVILGLLAVIAVPQVAKLLGGAERKTAVIQIDRLSGILDIYRLDVGRYPSSEDGLPQIGAVPAFGAGRPLDQCAQAVLGRRISADIQPVYVENARQLVYLDGCCVALGAPQELRHLRPRYHRQEAKDHQHDQELDQGEAPAATPPRVLPGRIRSCVFGALKGTDFGILALAAAGYRHLGEYSLFLKIFERRGHGHPLRGKRQQPAGSF